MSQKASWILCSEMSLAAGYHFLGGCTGWSCATTFIADRIISFSLTVVAQSAANC